jgi:hypothetical protein
MRVTPTLAALTAIWMPVDSQAATLTVGPGQQYATIAAAVAASADGDTLAVQAGTYTNDFAEIGTKITLSAIGGRVTMKATEPLPNEKGILITDTDITITGFTFTGAHISNGLGGNGAGIRYQAGNLVLNRCYFHDNQDGLLGNADPAGSITITASEFAHNGDKTGPNAGYTHNIYIGAIARADIENSYFHNANVGHEIKSRAAVTIVNNTRVVDGPSGTASYSIDLPNGGAASITNDQIEQGPDSQNPVIISYGEEGNTIPGSALTVRNTLIENDLTAHVPVGVANPYNLSVMLSELNIYGLTPDELVSGAATQSDITYLTSEPSISTKHPW